MCGDWPLDLDHRSSGSTLQRFALLIGSFGVKHSRWVLAITLALTAALTPFALTLGYDDDVIQFLPEGNEAVDRFQDIGRRFHGLNVGVLGVEAIDEDVFTLERLRLIQRMTDELVEIDGIAFTMSLTALPDIEVSASGAGGVGTTELNHLVGTLPTSMDAPGAAARLDGIRSRVLSLDHVRGSLVSESGDAALVLCNFAPDSPVKPTADAVRARVEALIAETGAAVRVHYGGAPWIGAYVADRTREDIARLSPFVCLAVILIILLTARSLPGTFVALGSVGVGIAWIMGAMGVVGAPLTLVSASLPVLLVALGSAYSIHFLTRVLANLDQGMETRADAVREAAGTVGPPIFIAGLTTALAFLSFTVMDIRPMREFGVWMFGGTLVIVLLAILVVPAACTLLPLRARAGDRAPAWAIAGLVGGARWVARRPVVSFGLVALLVAVASFYSANIGTHMDTRAFFAPDSEPIQAEDFLETKLGGSLFLQVEISGDVKDPMALRQISRFTDEVRALPGVTGVQSVAEVMELSALAMTGAARIPVDPAVTRSIATLTESDRSVAYLVDRTWEHALVHVKLGGFDTARAEEMADELAKIGEQIGAARSAVKRETLSERAGLAELEEVVSHLQVLFAANGQPVDTGVLRDRLKEAMRTLEVKPEALRADVRGVLEEAFDPEDPLIEPREGVDVAALAWSIAGELSAGTLTGRSLGGRISQVASEEELSDPESLGAMTEALRDQLEELHRSKEREAFVGVVQTLVGSDAPERLRRSASRVVGRLVDPVAFVPSSEAGVDVAERSQSLTVEVSGYPMVYAGMNESVYRNQISSLVTSGILVLLALTWFFRSPLLAIAAGIPAGITLLLTFGLMGFLDMRMDVGTSMIASIALGVGIDYAVHLVWKHGVVPPAEADAALEESLTATGWGIVINALEVAVGFGILVLGTIVPMQNFGMLTAFAMLVSAAATLLLVPSLVRGVAWVRWRKTR
jgi:predicted RND superfamily exporter protein